MNENSHDADIRDHADGHRFVGPLRANGRQLHAVNAHMLPVDLQKSGGDDEFGLAAAESRRCGVDDLASASGARSDDFAAVDDDGVDKRQRERIADMACSRTERLHKRDMDDSAGRNVNNCRRSDYRCEGRGKTRARRRLRGGGCKKAQRC